MAGTTVKARDHARGVAPLSPDRFALILWLGFVVTSLFLHRDAIAMLAFPDPDNAMRLAQVRDLIAGQNWLDTTQYRANPAGGGGLTHWSRFIDAPVAALIALLSLFLEQPTAERLALAIYPPVLALPLLLVISRILQLLGDRQFTFIGLAIAATTLSYLHHFAPLNIDHHNWQVLLSATLLLLALQPGSFSNGFLSALVASIYVEISLEGLPFLGFFWALFVLDWLRNPAGASRLRGFSAGMILLPALWSLPFRGVTYVASVFCDSFSSPYILATALAGAVFFAFLTRARHGDASLPQRVFVVLTAGIAFAIAFVLSGPSCLAGPFGELEPIVRTLWYEPILEGRPLWKQESARLVAYVVPTAIGSGATIWACCHARGRPDAEKWARLGIIILFSVALAMFVIRTLAVAHAYMVPAFAALATQFWRWGHARPGGLRRFCGNLFFVLAIPTFDMALGYRLSSLTAGSSPASREKFLCLSQGNPALAGQPPALIFSSIDLAPTLLVSTPHSVVTTGHHRNHAAIDRVLSAFLAPPALARSMIDAEGARYLVFCEKELTGLAAVSPQGLAAFLLQGRRIDWLEPKNELSSGGMRVYRIVPSAFETARSARNPTRH